MERTSERTNERMDERKRERMKNEIPQINNWFSVQLTTTHIPMHLNFLKQYLCLIDIDFFFSLSLSLKSFFFFF